MDKNDDLVTRYAAKVVARMYSGDMSSVEEQELQVWLEAEPCNRVEFQAVLDLWDRLGQLSSCPEVSAAVSSDGGFWRRILPLNLGKYAVAAAGIAAFGLVFAIADISWIDRGALSPALASYGTGIGEQRDVVLQDGSTVTLNTNTKLLVEYRDDQRRIILDYGEAYFDIVSDPARPLTVEVGRQVVTVLGTQFNLHWTGPDVTVAVIDGLVAVRPSGSKYASKLQPVSVTAANRLELLIASDEVFLEAGTVAVFSEGSHQAVTTRQADDIDRYQNWRHGIVRFDREPLYKVIGEINRYTRTKIVIEDKSVMDLQVSGLFRLSDTAAILAGLERALPVKASSQFDRYVIVADADLIESIDTKPVKADY